MNILWNLIYPLLTIDRIYLRSFSSFIESDIDEGKDKKIIISVTIVIENKSETKENERKRDILIKDDLLWRTT